MKHRQQIIIGFGIVILPPLLSVIWTLSYSRQVNQRVAELTDPMFPILSETNDIAQQVDDLTNLFLDAALSPDEYDLDGCRLAADDLLSRIDNLIVLTQRIDARDLGGVPENLQLLRQYAGDYIAGSLKLLEEKQSESWLSQALPVHQTSNNMRMSLESLRGEINQTFAFKLDTMGQLAVQTRNVTLTTTTAAFLFGAFLALVLANRFGKQDEALYRANKKLGLSNNELQSANDLLENEVQIRIRAEEALRLSLEHEEALASVSELFTATLTPNLRKMVSILGETGKVDAAFLIIMTTSRDEIEQNLVWFAPHVSEHDRNRFHPELQGHPTWNGVLSKGKNLVVKQIEAPEAGHEGNFHRSGIESVLMVPITSDEDAFRGYMGFAKWDPHPWGKEDERILRVSCEILVNYLARKEAEERLKHDAFHDGLTGLPNRSLFMDRLTHMLERVERKTGNIGAVLFLDLDRFKPINDSLGHLVGDELLVQVAHRIRGCVRGMDTVARLGGDEFTILLEETSGRDEVEMIAQRIIDALGRPFKLGGNPVHTSASIGITLCEGHYQKPEDILRDADIAMYGAKSQGKARYEIFDEKRYAHNSAVLQLESGLRKALKKKEFQLFYQPMICAETGKLLSFEALLRWNKDGVEFVSPARFIPLAEEIGLIGPIGRWVIRETIQQIRAWLDAGLPAYPVAVNVSPKQFFDQDLPDYIGELIKAYDVPSNCLQVEITESLLMDNLSLHVAMLNRLKDMGLRISVDDFGTGYSSLNYLKRLPIHVVKIDRGFIREIPDDNDDAAITSAIIAMAHSLKLLVVAEGVETEEQLRFLKERGCDKFQGYYFSRPLPKDEATLFIKEGKIFDVQPAGC